MGQFRGGIAWQSLLEFNVHPLCMIIGMVFLQGDGKLGPGPGLVAGSGAGACCVPQRSFRGLRVQASAPLLTDGVNNSFSTVVP